jgi:hypothetical protein
MDIFWYLNNLSILMFYKIFLIFICRVGLVKKCWLIKQIPKAGIYF